MDTKEIQKLQGEDFGVFISKQTFGGLSFHKKVEKMPAIQFIVEGNGSL